jgi:hypothetical protein
MKTKLLVPLILFAAACASSQGPASQAPRPSTIENLATKVFRMDTGKVESGRDANVEGIRNETILVSRRTDSRTFFVEDTRYQPDNVSDAPDDQLIESTRRILAQLDVPLKEIDSIRVLTEKLQSARRGAGNTFVAGEITNGRRFVDATREIASVPVFSSRARVGLTRSGAVGSLEVHWPKIPEETVREAQRLQKLVRGQRFRAPEQRGAVVESVEAGILHSPAIGQVMDVVPVIRVIDAAPDAGVGRKRVDYIDANGRAVPLPRTFRELKLEPVRADRVVKK